MNSGSRVCPCPYTESCFGSEKQKGKAGTCHPPRAPPSPSLTSCVAQGPCGLQALPPALRLRWYCARNHAPASVFLAGELAQGLSLSPRWLLPLLGSGQRRSLPRQKAAWRGLQECGANRFPSRALDLSRGTREDAAPGEGTGN